MPFSSLNVLLLIGALALTLAEGASAAAGQSAALVARGKYLADAGDCISCHTAPGGRPLAGGRSIGTPFGSMTTPNITPDKATGIGAWTDDQFYRALHEGVGKNGDYLYPVFPYASYTKVTRADVLAIKAYLFSVPAVKSDPYQNNLEFPFDVRQSLAVWRRLYFHPGVFKPGPGKSAQINRGAYLVQGLGHCGECHTPRNTMGATVSGKAYEGGLVQGWFAPNITSDKHQGVGGWSDEQLSGFLKKGAARGKGVAIGPMSEVVHSSLQYLTDADIHAMSTYLKSIPAAAETTRANNLPSATPGPLGGDIYLAHCASCHQVNGHGIPGAIPALAGNGTVVASDPSSILSVVLGGVPATLNSPIMPAFGADLDDQSIAAVANYVRSRWANGAPRNADPHEVGELRKGIPVPFAGADAQCPSPANSDLTHLVADRGSGIPALLEAVNDENMNAQSRSILGKIKTAGVDSDRASIINDLSAGYCARLAGMGSLSALQKRGRYYRFGRLVYRELGGV